MLFSPPDRKTHSQISFLELEDRGKVTERVREREREREKWTWATGRISCFSLPQPCVAEGARLASQRLEFRPYLGSAGPRPGKSEDELVLRARLRRGSKHCRLCSAPPNNSISMARRSAPSTRSTPSRAPLLLALIIQCEAATVKLMASLPLPFVLLSRSECVCVRVHKAQKLQVTAKQTDNGSLYPTTSLICSLSWILIFIIYYFYYYLIILSNFGHR